jgi:hypothetical protein
VQRAKIVRVRTIGASFAALLACLAFAAPSGAVTFKVDCSKRVLQNRIDAVPAGSTILVKGRCGAITVDKNLTLDGNPSATIDAKGVGRPLTINGSPNLRLLDLRLTGGHVTGTTALGGGILHGGGTLTLRRVVVNANVADASGAIVTALGGGIYSQGGGIRLINSSVRGNVAKATGTSAGAAGGGIGKTGNLTLEHSSVNGNRVRAETTTSNANASGAGIVTGGGALRLEGSHVDGNRSTAIGTGAATGAHGVGGGIELSTAERVTILGSTVSGNVAVGQIAGGNTLAEGGGLHGFVERGTIRNTALRGNQVRATSSGAAVALANGAGAYLETSDGVSFIRTRVTAGQVVATTGGTATGLGGGLALAEGGPFRLDLSRVSGNTIDVAGGGFVEARGGGLIVTATADVHLTRSTVHGNRAHSSGVGAGASGGGVNVLNAVLDLRTSTVSGNVATTDGQALGGGIFLSTGGPHTIGNSTIAGNRAVGNTARGGAIDVDTTLTVTSATVARNSAKIGGGLYVESGTTTLKASILALNSAPDGPNCSQTVASAGWNLVSSTLGCTYALGQADKLGFAAKLGLLGAHGGPTATIPIKTTSPAKNAIPKAECPFPRDQRGVRRPQPKTGRCDIGAYERKPL